MQVNLGSTSDAVESVANVTDIHEAMFFHADDEVTRSSFGIWSLRWSPDGKEIIAGTGDSSLYIYDVESQRVSFLEAVAGIFPSAFLAQALLCSAYSFYSSHQALFPSLIVCIFGLSREYPAKNVTLGFHVFVTHLSFQNRLLQACCVHSIAGCFTRVSTLVL